MKNYILLLFLALLCVNCNGQVDQKIKVENNDIETPKGAWKVNKEFDENGNLIRYDSIYSWSSNSKFDNLSITKDSLRKSFRSKFFKNFSEFENKGFQNMFSQDSLFSNHFFNDSFFGSPIGKDLIDIDKLQQQMIQKQKKFLEKYQSEFINPKGEN